MPRLIVVEGIDGSGKTTIAKELEKQLNRINLKTKYLKGTGDGELGKSIVDIIFNKDFSKNIDMKTRQMLFFSSFLDLHNKYKDSDYQFIILDRERLSTIVYSALSSDQDEEFAKDILLSISKYLMPINKMIFLNSSVETCINRIRKREETIKDEEKRKYDHVENENMKENLEIVHKKYNDLISRILTYQEGNEVFDPKTIITIDTNNLTMPDVPVLVKGLISEELLLGA